MKINYEVSGHLLQPGTLVLWRSDELYHVMSKPTQDRPDTPEYGRIKLSDGGYEFEADIYLPDKFTTVSP